MPIKSASRIALLAISILATPAVAQKNPYDSGGPLIAEQAAFDVLFYDLRLRVMPADSTVRGRLLLHARIATPSNSIVLDLVPELDVERVTRHAVGGAAEPLVFERDGGQIRIRLPDGVVPGSVVDVAVEYGGTPGRGFSWNSTPRGDPWITTAVETAGADVWFPAKDHPSDEPDSVALHISVPEPLVVASNGVLRDVTDSGSGYRTYHWFVGNPINNYGVALNIAPYVTLETEYRSVTGETIPVFFWLLEENREQGREFLAEVLDHLAFFEDVAGPYPFRAEKYGLAETPYLGMEHQTIIAYGADFDNGAMTRGNDFGFDALHQHELAHEWYGNLMTAADWKDLWLHEGVAMYMQPLYLESRQGQEAYDEFMAYMRPSISARSTIAPRESMTARQIYSNDIYYKGAWVLHTLRYLIGEGPFRQSLRRLAYPNPALEAVTDGSQTWLATTGDFISIAEGACGCELGWFFEVYLRQPELPQLEVERGERGLNLRWVVPGGVEFALPVEVAIDGEITRVPMVGGTGSVRHRAGAAIEIDPAHRILMVEPGGGS